MNPSYKSTEFYTSTLMLLAGAWAGIADKISYKHSVWYVTIVVAAYIISRNLPKKHRPALLYSAVKSTEFWKYIGVVVYIGYSTYTQKIDYTTGATCLAGLQTVWSVARGWAKSMEVVHRTTVLQ